MWQNGNRLFITELWLSQIKYKFFNMFLNLFETMKRSSAMRSCRGTSKPRVGIRHTGETKLISSCESKFLKLSSDDIDSYSSKRLKIMKRYN